MTVPVNSGPNWPKGYIPTAAEWEAQWQSKVDGEGGQSDQQVLTNPIFSSSSRAPGPGGDQCGIIVPYYLYPNNPYTDPTVATLLNLARVYNRVPLIVIVNQPGSTGTGGPGPVWDGNIAAFITLLQGVGATVLGYVDTAFGARAVSAVETDILLWNQLYSATPLNGIFFDEFPFDPTFIPQYEGYYTYAHTNGYSLVVGNPGTNEGGLWYASPTADIMVINENDTWIDAADAWGNFVGGHSNYLWSLNAVLVYGQTFFDTGQFNSIKRYAKWFYVTEGVLPNPWIVLSQYLEQMFCACSNTSGTNYVYANPTTGASVTITSPLTILDPAGALATLTITFPNQPRDGDTVTVTTSQVIASLTLEGAGNTISNPAINLPAGGAIAYVFQGNNDTWYAMGGVATAASASGRGAGNLTATGTSQSTGLPISAGINILTDVPEGTGYTLPVDWPQWSEIKVLNEGANPALAYPGSGAQIEALGTNNPAQTLVGGMTVFTPTSAPPIQWVAR